jgi:hypothetical protein
LHDGTRQGVHVEMLTSAQTFPAEQTPCASFSKSLQIRLGRYYSPLLVLQACGVILNRRRLRPSSAAVFAVENGGDILRWIPTIASPGRRVKHNSKISSRDTIAESALAQISISTSQISGFSNRFVLYAV